MSRINDVGGMYGFESFDAADEHAGFQHEWEARVFAINRILLERGAYTLDEFRHAVERMEPRAYLEASYYERWLHAIETLVREKGIIHDF